MIRYAFVLSLKAHMGGQDYAEFESHGTLDLEPGSSRNAAFEHIRSTMLENARSQGVHGGTTTVFFSLEPDTLGGAS